MDSRTSCGDQPSSLIRNESAGGAVLVAATVLAMVFANTRLDSLYDALLSMPLTITVGTLSLAKPLLLWINDGLMAVFFFVVGLEIKHEVLDGRLSSWRKVALPVIAAAGGMVVPALVYLAVTVTAGDAQAMRGWAIPAATDIAFAIGVLAIVGRRVPPGLKAFLLALAIIDDLGAIVIIAAFFTDELSLVSLALAGIGLAALIVLNLSGVRRLAPYAIIGVLMWVCVLKSGVHATLAGVLVAFTIPARSDAPGRPSLLHASEEALRGWVSFGIMPLFAFANAGVPLGHQTWATAVTPVALAVALGLLLGKPIGIYGAAWLSTRLGICRLPEGVAWPHIRGAAVLGGIGFTMSLFIGTLAFDNPQDLNAVRLGVMGGLLVSALLGYALLTAAKVPQAGG